MKNLMLQMMGAFAQFERSLIRERQHEGIAAAKAKSKKWGRRPSLNDCQIKRANTLLNEAADTARRRENTRLVEQGQGFPESPSRYTLSRDAKQA